MKVTLKLATSLDGRIATATGESKWITGEAAREQVHRLRAAHDAVMVGVQTAIADDPDLSVRLPGYSGRQPARVVLDSKGRLPLTSKLVVSARAMFTVVITTRDATSGLVEAGVAVLKVAERDGRCDPRGTLEALAAHLDPAEAVMIEGGGQVAASFVAAGLVDAIEWFRAPIILGDEGRPAIGEFVLERLSDAPRFKRLEVISLGDDLWERYERL